MKKLKNALILLLTIGLIGCGAILPGIVAAVMDRDAVNQTGTREMASVALEMGEEKQLLSTAGKLDLLRRGQTINITEKEASMTLADVNGAVETAMAEYIDAGIFEWFDFDAWITQPKLCIDPDSPDNYGVFWTVTIINKMEPYQTLSMDIDDETGKIYSIRYDTYGEYRLEGVWERNAAIMDSFVHVYLSQLGMMEQDAEPYLEYGELDGEVLCGGFYFTDEHYGRCGIEFYVTGTGSFWNYFPE